MMDIIKLPVQFEGWDYLHFLMPLPSTVLAPESAQEMLVNDGLCYTAVFTLVNMVKRHRRTAKKSMAIPPWTRPNLSDLEAKQGRAWLVLGWENCKEGFKVKQL